MLSICGVSLITTHTHLWNDPVFADRRLGREHTLGPGRDVPTAVVGVALEHQLPLALCTGLEGPERHAVCQAVHQLADNTISGQNKVSLLSSNPKHDVFLIIL